MWRSSLGYMILLLLIIEFLSSRPPSETVSPSCLAQRIAQPAQTVRTRVVSPLAHVISHPVTSLSLGPVEAGCKTLGKHASQPRTMLGMRPCQRYGSGLASPSRTILLVVESHKSMASAALFMFRLATFTGYCHDGDQGLAQNCLQFEDEDG